jgi:hypothetical protein
MRVTVISLGGEPPTTKHAINGRDQLIDSLAGVRRVDLLFPAEDRKESEEEPDSKDEHHHEERHVTSASSLIRQPRRGELPKSAQTGATWRSVNGLLVPTCG